MQALPQPGILAQSANKSSSVPRNYRYWASVTAVLACASPAFGTASTWISPTSSTWLTPINWSTNPTIPNAIDDSAILGTSAGKETITLDAPITLGNLTFDSPSDSFLTAGSGNLTLQTSAGNASITVTPALNHGPDLIAAPINFASNTTITNNASLGNFSLFGAFTGSSDITFNGSSPIVLSNTNSNWTSNLFINAATLTASSASALGTGNVTINTGATLNLSNSTSNSLTLNGGTLHATTSITLNKPTTISADSVLSGSPFSINSLAGSGNLTLTNGNSSFLFGNSSFSGNISLQNGASLFVVTNLSAVHNISLVAGTRLTIDFSSDFAPSAIHATGGYLELTESVDPRPVLATNATLDGILLDVDFYGSTNVTSLDLNAFANPTTLRIAGFANIRSSLDIRPDLATHTFRFGLANTTNGLTIGTVLADHDSSPANLDVKFSNVALSAANTFTGVTTVANATLFIENANALGSGSGTDSDATIVNANGILRLTSHVTLANEKIIVNPNGTLTASNSTFTYANPIVMNGGTLGSATFTGPISGNGNFFISGAILAGNSTYTGNATIVASSTINSPNALSPLGSNFLTAGNLTINSPFVANLYQSGGTVLLAIPASSYALPLIMNNGNLILTSANSPTITNTLFVSNINTITTSLSALIFGGGISGNGTLTLQSRIIISGPTHFSGILNQTGFAQFSNVTSSGILALSNASLTGTVIHTGNLYDLGQISVSNAPTTIHGSLLMNGNLTINSKLTVDHLFTYSTNNGTLSGSGNLTTSDSELDINAGTMNFTGRLIGPSTIHFGGVYNPFQNTTSLSQLPFGYSAPIFVDSGTLGIAPAASSSNVTINVASNAFLSLGNGTFLDPINLNNSNGANGSAAVFAAFGANAVLGGKIDLGTIGSNFGGGITFTGTITGGSLNQANGTLTISTSSANYTGTTNINNGSSLYLSGNGSLHSTAPITINKSTLAIFDDVTVVADRIPDLTPLILNRGTVQLFAGNNVASETLGNVTVASGVNTITTLDNNTLASSILKLSSLSRNAGATLHMLVNSLFSQKIQITGQPISSYLGPGYVVGSTDPLAFSLSFASYSSNGISSAAASSVPETSWSSSTIPNVDLNTSLSASRNVLAIQIYANTLNLGNNSLNVVSGGLILHNSTIAGTSASRLTAGGNSSRAELVFNGVGVITLSNNITNNPGPNGKFDPVPGGPLDTDNGIVDATFSGASANGTDQFSLSGNNSYTGTTYIDSSTLSILSPGAMPSGPIVIEGGNLNISNSPVTSGPITLDDGTITVASINPAALNLHNGTITGALVGVGTLSKSTFGTSTVGDLSGFTGPIVVTGGRLILGTSNTAIYPNNITLQDATLSFNDVFITLNGPMNVSGNATFGGGFITFSPSSIAIAPQTTLAFFQATTIKGPIDPFTDATNPNVHASVAGSQITFSLPSSHVATLSSTLVTVSAGAALTVDRIDGSNLTINGSVALTPGITGPVSRTNVSITGTFDINEHAFIFQSANATLATDLANLQNNVISGFNNGNWHGKGIVSSLAAANPSKYSIAVFLPALLLDAQFGGSLVDQNSIVVTSALLGDTNLDQTIDVNDLSLLSANWLSTSATWIMGDFNNDQTVDAKDLTLLANNWPGGPNSPSFQAALAQFPNLASIPEPTSLSLLALASPLLLRRRKKS